MKDLEMKILEEVTNGTLDTNDILRKLLFLYGVTERYFYHYSYVSHNGNGNINTNELIECRKEFYDKLMENKRDKEFHKPISYMSDDIPSDKKLKMILYVR